MLVSQGTNIQICRAKQNYIKLVKVENELFLFLPRARVRTVLPASVACSCTVNLQKHENQRFGQLKRGWRTAIVYTATLTYKPYWLWSKMSRFVTLIFKRLSPPQSYSIPIQQRLLRALGRVNGAEKKKGKALGTRVGISCPRLFFLVVLYTL